MEALPAMKKYLEERPKQKQLIQNRFSRSIIY